MADSTIKFIVNLSDFQYIKTRQDRKFVRFSLSWAFCVGNKNYGDKIKGCIAFYDDTGALVWFPHRIHLRRNITGDMHAITPDLYELVLGKLRQSNHMKFLGESPIRPVPAHELNPEAEALLAEEITPVE